MALAPYYDGVALGRFDKMLFDKDYLVTVQKFDNQLAKTR